MIKYFGELDCMADLADIVGEEVASLAWRGKLNYFSRDGWVFGVSDYAADSLFEEMDQEEATHYYA